MKRGILFTLLLFSVTMVLSLATVAAAAEPYKIGAVFSVTGRGSFLGEPERNSAVMFEDMINKAGGINGHPVKMVIYDDEGDATKCNLMVKRLIKRDKVLAIIGPSLSGLSLGIIPVLEENGIPNISCAASIKIVKPVKKWVFKTPQTDSAAVESIFAHMIKNGLSKAAIITVSTGYGASGRVQLKRLASKMGITLVADELFGPKDTDMTAQLTKIRGTDAEAVICWSIGPTQVIVVKNWKQLGMDKKCRFYQSHGWGSLRNVQMAGKAAEGVFSPLGRVVVADILPENNPQKGFASHYKNLYEKTFKTELSTFGGHAWDALHMLKIALAAAGPDKAKIRDNLENIKGFAGTGGVFNMSPQDHCGLDASAFEMIVVKNGTWALAD
ncbi:MAG: ABC transporter substrate-binding protein [Thermodesulfobacteriota bacterium]|nr:ABC transporter substrate-binding protein [Thermodesulfobacteriota bacterium]